MGVDDQLRNGTLSPEQLEDLHQRVTALEQLEDRVGALEENASGDGAAFPALVEVTPEGDVTNIESEVVNELVEEEGDLIIGGKGGKAKTLHKGAPGQVLGVNAEGELEWQEPGEGGAVKGEGILNSFFPEDGSSTAKIEGLGFAPAQVFLQPIINNDPENPAIEAQSWSVKAEADGFSVLSAWPTSTKGIPTSSFFYLAFR